MARTFLVRFAALYTLLNAFNFSIWILPMGRQIRHASMQLSLPVVRMVGELMGIKNIAVPPTGTGSSDNAFDWVFMAFAIILAAIGAVVWSSATRFRVPERTHRWLYTIIRYGLAGNMLAYGVVKLLPIQFSSPEPDVLATAYGDSTPRSLLWAFMGFSPIYCLLAGLAEMAGVLLFFRRTTLLAACICFGVMLNVTALNFLYDVPVKLFAVHFLVASLFLIWPYRSSLVGLFWSHQMSESVQLLPIDFPSRIHTHRRALKCLIIFGILATTVALPTWRYVKSRSKQPVAYPVGVFDRVFDAEFEMSVTSPIRITVRDNGEVSLWGIHERIGSLKMDPPLKKGFSARSEQDSKSPLFLEFTDSDHLNTRYGDGNEMTFKRRKISLDWTFRWVSE